MALYIQRQCGIAVIVCLARYCLLFSVRRAVYHRTEANILYDSVCMRGGSYRAAFVCLE